MVSLDKCSKAKGVFPGHDWQTIGANPKQQKCMNGCGKRRPTPKVEMQKSKTLGKKGWTTDSNPKREINAWAGGKLAKQTPDGNTQNKGCGKTVKQTVGFMFLVVFLMIKIRKWSHRG